MRDVHEFKLEKLLQNFGIKKKNGEGQDVEFDYVMLWSVYDHCRFVFFTVSKQYQEIMERAFIEGSFNIQQCQGHPKLNNDILHQILIIETHSNKDKCKLNLMLFKEYMQGRHIKIALSARQSVR